MTLFECLVSHSNSVSPRLTVWLAVDGEGAFGVNISPCLFLHIYSC